MHKHRQQKIVPFSPQHMYDLVCDIEAYPDFLPWCDALRIISKQEREIVAQMCVGFKGITERFTSRVISVENPYEILVMYEDGPFKTLLNTWKFHEHLNGCKVDFYIEFAFKNRMLDMVMAPFFNTAVETMVQAFEQRAEYLYR